MKYLISTITATLLISFSLNSLSQRAFEQLALSNPKQYRAEIEGKLPIIETPVLSSKESTNKLLLENGYAQYTIKNPDDWPPNQEGQFKATDVRVIFTKYPKDSAFWLTDYQWLLSKRLTALFDLDSNLNSLDINYSILLQTDCDNEFETMQLFHGIEITYEPLDDSDLNSKEFDDSITIALDQIVMKNSSSIKRLKLLMYQKRYSMDSTVYKAIDRNRAWKNSLLIMDWTGSMYGHGAEALLWHALNEPISKIENAAFFNDGDKLKDRKKIIGYTGGIYSTKAKPVDQAVKLMRRVEKKGNGGDSPENDMEAISESIKQVADEENVILVADNGSCIRDFVLQQCLTRPVHIILCNTKNGINPQYINLAWKSGGSLHTKKWDIHNIQELLEEDKLLLNGVKYVVSGNGWIMPANREDNYFAFCDQYYSYPKRVRPKKRQKEPDCYFTE
jgi:hypothetical protein